MENEKGKDNNNDKNEFSLLNNLSKFIKRIIIGLPFENYNNPNFNNLPEKQKREAYYQKLVINNKEKFFNMIVSKKPELIEELDLENYSISSNKDNLYFKLLCASVFFSMSAYCIFYLMRKKSYKKTLALFQISCFGIYYINNSKFQNIKSKMIKKYDYLLNLEDFNEFMMNKSTKQR